MSELPTGTVTFLFTDIEGSTRLLEEHGERYAELLAEHRGVLRAAIELHGGVEVDTQGDAFFVAFKRAGDALAAAAEAQEALEIPVRIGIHTGEPQLVDGGYVGIDVHRAARICGVAHGCQVVVSERAAQLLDSTLLRDLGLHRLKDLGEPVKLFQLGEDQFPPLRSLNASNLPAQPSELIGRERELEELQALVRDGVRLVTLTGPGGSGKTRLALQTAAELVDEFRDGVFWVSLAAVADPELVLPTVGQTLGAKGQLAEHVDEKRMLLLLDNLEQVLGFASALAELLERCPNLQLVATSRALLRIAGEREYPVDPLPEDDAVTLFRERAASAEPLEAVREICRRLDGLPLAIELAAARTRLLPPRELLERLERALPILTGGRKDAPERQRTLRATIEWSYELLDDEEKRLFRRLAVFAGSFTVAAAEEVCDADLDTLESLLEKSLARRWESGRLGMLETIREYATELLDASDEAEGMRRRHAERFLAVAKSANLQVEALGRRPQRHDLVLPEQSNLRAAIDWAAQVEPELALRLTVALENFWATNNPGEGAGRLRNLLERHDAPILLRAQATRALAAMTQLGRDLRTAEGLYGESLAFFREAGDEEGAATIVFRLSTVARGLNQLERAHGLSEESLREFRRLGHKAGECQALGNLGALELMDGARERARTLFEQSLALAREIEFRWWELNMLGGLAHLSLEDGQPEDAERLAQDGLRVADQIGDRLNTIWFLGTLAACAAVRGAASRAGTLWGALEVEAQRNPGPAAEEAREELASMLESVRGGGEFDAAVVGGRSLSRDEAVEFALGDDD